jgi:Arc/MetJ-type ribon-helix-helix transcriptional regulator
MVKMLVSLPAPLKAKLESLRGQGYTVSGYIRALLELDLAEREAVGLLKTNKKKGR